MSIQKSWKFLMFIFFYISQVLSEKSQFQYQHLKIDEYLLRQSIFYGVAVVASEKLLSNNICQNQLVSIAENIYNRKKWAIKLLDASGTPSSGLHWGETHWLGSRNQCEETMLLKNISLSPALGPLTKESNDDLPPFRVAYYTAYFKHNSDIHINTHNENEFRITLGLCLPDSCDTLYLKKLLQKYFDSNILNHQKTYNTTYEMEEVKKIFDDYSWLKDNITISIGIVLSILIMLCIIGTIYDLKYYQPTLKLHTFPFKKINDEKNCMIDNKTENIYKETIQIPLKYRMLKCFSLYSNNRAIFNTSITKDSIPCIHGLRFFATLMICSGHTCYFMKEFYEDKLKFYYKLGIVLESLLHLMFFSVDTAFCISGYILASQFFKKEYVKQINCNFGVLKKINLFTSNVLKRFFRLTPSYILILGINLIIIKWRSNASSISLDVKDDINCPNYWWRNLFYIHNLFPSNEICMVWSWYFSNDMQFFITINFLLVLSTTHFYTASSILIVIFFSSIFYTANLVYTIKFIPYLDEIQRRLREFYFNPFIRIGPYIIGVFAAFIVFHYKKISINKYIAWLMWILSFAIIVYLILLMTNRNVSLEFSMVYMSLSRILWALTISWTIIACETGNGGIIGSVLSLKYLFPFTQISYIVQLVNPVIILLIASFLEKSHQINAFNIIPTGIGHIVIIYITSYILTLLIELPNMTLIRLIFDQTYERKIANKQN